ncbi:MAG: PAS domain S-box protein [Candidatus Omnitrophica bacterium]|nr:PAS domain S-box protein [Candidatus Omnitrophota bacterium]
MTDFTDVPDQLIQLIDALQTHLCILSPDTKITQLNRCCRQHFEKVVSDPVGKPFTALVSPADHEAFSRMLNRLSREEPSAEFEHTFSESNGTIRNQRWQFTVRFDGMGEVHSYLAEGRDISRYKVLEQALHQCEKRVKLVEAAEGADRSAMLNTICQAIQDAVVIMDHSGCIRFWGGGAERIFGYTEEEVVGKDLHSILAPQRYHEAAREAVAKFRHTGIGQVLNKIVETEGRRKDGTEIPMELFLSPLKIDDRWCALGVLRDISQRRQAENNIQVNLAEIRDAEKLLNRILNLLPMRVFWKDRELRYLGCNDLFAKDAGMSCAADMIGKDDRAMSWRDQAELYRQDDLNVMDNGVERINFEEPQSTPDGRTIYLLTSKVPLTDEEGRVCGVLGMYHDITDRKEAEIKMKLLIEELEQFQDLAIDRENTLIDLKKQVNTLSRELGRAEPYDLSFLGPDED